MAGELVVQAGLINGGVIALDIGTKDIPRAVRLQVPVDVQGALAATAVPLDMLAPRVNGQSGFQNAGQHF